MLFFTAHSKKMSIWLNQLAMSIPLAPLFFVSFEGLFTVSRIGSKSLVWYSSKHSVSDTSLFYLAERDARLYILIYVDDILLIGNNSSRVFHIISQLAALFSLKRLGPVNYFLAFKTTRGQNGIHLSQSKYCLDLLKRTKMLDAKPCPTPMMQSNKLHLNDSPTYENPSQYRSTIGALQYLTLGRLDIAFIVNKLSQFL